MEEENPKIFSPHEESVDASADNSKSDSTSISIDRIAELLQAGNLKEADYLWGIYLEAQRDLFFDKPRKTLCNVFCKPINDEKTTSSSGEINFGIAKHNELIKITFEELFYVFCILSEINSKSNDPEEVGRINKVLTLLSDFVSETTANESGGEKLDDYQFDKKIYSGLPKTGKHEVISWDKYILELRKSFFEKPSIAFYNIYNDKSTEIACKNSIIAKLYELIDASTRELVFIFSNLVDIYRLNSDQQKISHVIRSFFLLNELLKKGFNPKYTAVLKNIIFAEGIDFRSYIPPSSGKGKEICDYIEVEKQLTGLCEKVTFKLEKTPHENINILQHASELSALFQKISPASQSIRKNILIRLYKTLENKRKTLSSPETKTILNKSMFVLAKALCSQKEYKPYGRFNDIYWAYHAIIYDKELREDVDIKAFVSNGLREARKIGKELIEAELVPSTENFSFFLSRLGEVCRAHRHFDCADSRDELDTITLEAIEYLERATSLTNEIRGKSNNYPQIGECYEALRKYEKAIETYKKLIDLGSQVGAEKSWETRKNIAECYGILGQLESKWGDQGEAEVHFQSSEFWYLEASKIWEPALDLSNSPAKVPNNATLHTLLARLYFTWADKSCSNKDELLKKSERQARLHLVIEEREKTANYSLWETHRKSYNFTRSILGRSLLSQRLNVEAIAVFKQLTDSDRLSELTLEQQLYYLNVLKLLYIWEKDAEGINAINEKMKLILTQSCIEDISLWEKVLSVLISPENMKVYLRNCKKLLKDGQVHELLKELEFMIQIDKQMDLFHREDPYLLTLLGEVYRERGEYQKALKKFKGAQQLNSFDSNQAITTHEIGKTYLKMGEFENAIKYFTKSVNVGGGNPATFLLLAKAHRLNKDYDVSVNILENILSNPADKEPNKTIVEIAKTAWEQYEKEGNDKNIQKACDLLFQLISGKVNEIYIGERYAISQLAKMASHTTALFHVVKLLQDANDRDTASNIASELGGMDNLPSDIIGVCLEKIKTDLPKASISAYVKILIIYLNKAYFSGEYQCKSFQEFGNKIFSKIMGLEPDQRRSVLFELLVGGRGMVLKNIVNSYINEASQVIQPLTLDENSICQTLKDPSLLSEIKKFLQKDPLELYKPKAYGRYDPSSLDDLMNEFKNKLTSVLFFHAHDKKTSITTSSDSSRKVSRLAAREAFRLMEEPFFSEDNFLIRTMAIASSLSVNLKTTENGCQVALSFNDIDPAHKPEERLRDISEKLSTLPSSIFSFQTESLGSGINIKLDMSLEVPRLMDDGFHTLTDFLTYIDGETKRYFGGGGQSPDANYYNSANKVFPCLSASIFGIESGKWFEFYWARLDSDFCGFSDWVNPKNTLRGVVHTLKDHLESVDLTGERISEIRRYAITLRNNIFKICRYEIFGGNIRDFDLKQCVETMLEKSCAGKYDLNCEPESAIFIHKSCFEDIFITLLSNALKATRDLPPEKQRISISITASDQKMTFISLKNCHDDRPANEGTGIGHEFAKEMIKRFAGKMKVIDDDIQFEVLLSIPSEKKKS